MEKSKILEEDRKWMDCKTSTPEVGVSVVIIMVNRDVYRSNEETGEVYYMEEAAVAKWLGDHWEINPPYHKYSISSFMDHEKINDGIEVSHWAIPEENEVEAWEHRLDLFNEYEKLDISIDADKEETLYRALSLGAALIESIYPQYDNEDDVDTLRKFYTSLKDLQWSIDKKAGE